MTNTKRKLGVIIQYYSFRNDVRELIKYLSNYYELVLFYSEKETKRKELPDSIEKRPIKSYRSTIWNKVWNTLYRVLGNTPSSSINKLNWSRRRFGSSNKKLSDYVELISAYLAHYLPDIIDFDIYVQYLAYNETRISDIDKFLSFTDVNDPYFIAQLINNEKIIITYVYSWDHAAKYHKFSKKYILYLVWNQHIKEDLIIQHGISTDNIMIVGSTQLSLLHSYLNSLNRFSQPANRPYIYFAASAGYKAVAEQEVNYVLFFARKLAEIAPDIQLVFRPYPLLTDWSLYESILSLDNVVFDNFRFENKTVVFTKDDLSDKFRKIEQALAVFHCGSTFGMEAAYFDTPVFFIRFEDFPFKKKISSINKIENFIYQYHISKYLDLVSYRNVVSGYEDIESVLQLLLKKPENFLDYNESIKSYTKLQSIESINSEFIRIIENTSFRL